MLSRVLRAIAFSAALAAPLYSALPASAAGSDLRVTLFGTGSPIPIPNRFSQSTLVRAGGYNLLFDFGRGASIRLSQLGVPIGSIDANFLTHMHSDRPLATSGAPAGSRPRSEGGRRPW